ncbi:MAG: glutamate synthase large subunit [Planctomycetota bacterium]|nr:MAG: glutamate synthase large subunit [Planctomycetota bacterium]
MSNYGYPKKEGLYDPSFEHDACGIGCITNIKGIKSHKVVQDGIKILVNLTHRGATGYDPNTGDGAGILTQIPHEFFKKEFKKINVKIPEVGQYGIGVIFLPPNEKSIEKIKKSIQSITEKEGQKLLGWRDVPCDSSAIGDLARESEPCIKQFIISNNCTDQITFERKLYVIRKVIEKEMNKLGQEFSSTYLPSLSSRTIIYKGLLLADQIDKYFADLNDKDFQSAIAVVHQRFSTNTFPTWSLAQPFRFISHNGEINTLKGNVNAMKARYKSLNSDIFGKDIKKITPFIQENGSDSAAFDNTLELLALANRSLPHAMMMMIPEAWGELFPMGVDRRGFYEYHSMIMEPWDGPASMVFTDGTLVGATLDRNGLRPGRYQITTDDHIIISSESGVLEYPPEMIKEKGRLQPGKMMIIDTEKGRVVYDHEIKASVYRKKPYRRWVEANKINIRGFNSFHELNPKTTEDLLNIQLAANYTHEDIDKILIPMAATGHEPLGSMGFDSPIAVLSDQEKLLFDYFKQTFAQVTNPPIDPIRERLVMSLRTHIGHNHNILEEGSQCAQMFSLDTPVVNSQDLSRIISSDDEGLKAITISTLFDPDSGANALKEAIENICNLAVKYSTEDYSILVLSDKGKSKTQMAIPSLLAIAAVHHHLINQGLRTQTSILIECSDARETMHFALLIGFGASAVCPYLAFETIANLVSEKRLPKNIDAIKASENYINSINIGLLKVLSKMGISTIRSYRGAQVFECLGLAEEVIEKYFSGTPSRIGGIPLEVIQEEATRIHRKGFPLFQTQPLHLPDGGELALRSKGEKHLWTAKTVSYLQQAVRNQDQKMFDSYTELINNQLKHHFTLRGLLDFKKRKSISIDEVESASEIMKRFCTGAMSFGSISKEAHETLALAMNEIGGKSNTGEGGEDSERFGTLPDGSSKNSAIKQVASGRFGVTSEYLSNAKEIQIKIAQGAKPGEGGQLPGHKVSVEIAKTRKSTPGVSLISPPPHHDIYSIEDLAQLIFDLKHANPQAQVSVKLVAEAGVGTIAAGVAKAKADQITIAGYDGGTGASPISSIKHAGVPWELGLTETQQVLVKNKLRGRVRLQTDGQLKTGRDVIFAALLGAEEFGFATAPLVATGCIMMRKCHNNTCPVGIATQDKVLREKYDGKPEHVINFFNFIAEDVRSIMATLGFKTIEDMVGQYECLEKRPLNDHWKAQYVDFAQILHIPKEFKTSPLHKVEDQVNLTDASMDNQFAEQAKDAIENKTPVIITANIKNTERATGALLSNHISNKYGAAGLPDNTITINLKGTAGQSFGAFTTKGITLNLDGEANDYVGKGLSGGIISIRAPAESIFDPSENVIIGNTTLYGATSGKLFVAGYAGERFAVRNSGATTVVEGVGDHCCEYMTGGIVVVLGKTGVNFAAGMSGGLAYAYNPTHNLDLVSNLDMVDIEELYQDEDLKFLYDLITEHKKMTNSIKAEYILDNWEDEKYTFVKVFPIEYKRILKKMKPEKLKQEEIIHHG